MLLFKFKCFVVMLVLLARASYASKMHTANKKYREKKWSQAAAYYYKILSTSDKKHDIIRSEFYLGKTLEHLKLFVSSSIFYSGIVRKGPSHSNPYFTKALKRLSSINRKVSLGQAQILQVITDNIKPSAVPKSVGGLFYYYRGIEFFNNRKYQEAKEYFKNVHHNSKYYVNGLFYSGVVNNLLKNTGLAISYFNKVKKILHKSDNPEWLKEESNLNIARIYYQQKNPKKSIHYYAKIPRFSQNWLQALFEAAWAFFIMEKPNNALGNLLTLHSPFYIDRFFPESYILQAIIFLRMCLYKQVRSTLKNFKIRYKPVLKNFKKLLHDTKKNKIKLFKIVYKYKSGHHVKYHGINEILETLSMSDAYRNAGQIIINSRLEIKKLGRGSSLWRRVLLIDKLDNFLETKVKLAEASAAQRMYVLAQNSYKYLSNLSQQTKLIEAEMMLGKVKRLKRKLSIKTAPSKGNFIGGMQALRIGQNLEYWPFEGEWWEDELGGYVYNVNSMCPK